MTFYDPFWWKRSPFLTKGLGPAIAAQEGHGKAHNWGTPRHPRTAKKARAAALHNHAKGPRRYRDEARPFRKLLASGYYDDYRKAFDHADD